MDEIDVSLITTICNMNEICYPQSNFYYFCFKKLFFKKFVFVKNPNVILIRSFIFEFDDLCFVWDNESMNLNTKMISCSIEKLIIHYNIVWITNLYRRMKSLPEISQTLNFCLNLDDENFLFSMIILLFFDSTFKRKSQKVISYLNFKFFIFEGISHLWKSQYSTKPNKLNYMKTIMISLKVHFF